MTGYQWSFYFGVFMSRISSVSGRNRVLVFNELGTYCFRAATSPAWLDMLTSRQLLGPIFSTALVTGPSPGFGWPAAALGPAMDAGSAFPPAPAFGSTLHDWQPHLKTLRLP